MKDLNRTTYVSTFGLLISVKLDVASSVWWWKAFVMKLPFCLAIDRARLTYEASGYPYCIFRPQFHEERALNMCRSSPPSQTQSHFACENLAIFHSHHQARKLQRARSEPQRSIASSRQMMGEERRVCELFCELSQELGASVTAKDFIPSNCQGRIKFELRREVELHDLKRLEVYIRQSTSSSGLH
jgi:hypothetical protein